MTPDPDPRLDPRAQARAFQRAASHYASAAALTREVGRRQLERFDLMRLSPAVVLDLGAGPGIHTEALAVRFPQARVLALDRALPMLVQFGSAAAPSGVIARLWHRLGARSGTPPNTPGVLRVCADWLALPFAPASVDLVWSNFAFQHAADLPLLLSELHRLLRVGGLLMASLPGPDSGLELRHAFHQAGLAPRLHHLPDMHDVGDALVAARFADPVVDMERITLEYPTAAALWRDARALGAIDARAVRPRGLTTPRMFARIERALAEANGPGPLRLTVEVVYAHAWKAAPRTTEEGHAIVRAEQIGGRKRRGAA